MRGHRPTFKEESAAAISTLRALHDRFPAGPLRGDADPVGEDRRQELADALGVELEDVPTREELRGRWEGSE